MERFEVVFNGKSYFIVDKSTQDWYKMGTKKAAYEKAADWNYQNNCIESGKITDRGAYV